MYSTQSAQDPSAPSRLDACALISHTGLLGSLMRAALQSAGEMKYQSACAFHFYIANNLGRTCAAGWLELKFLVNKRLSPDYELMCILDLSDDIFVHVYKKGKSYWCAPKNIPTISKVTCRLHPAIEYRSIYSGLHCAHPDKSWSLAYFCSLILNYMTTADDLKASRHLWHLQPPL